MKKITASKTSFLPDNSTLIQLEKEVAVELIQDLVQDLAGTGTGKLVLRTSDNQFLVLKVVQ